MTTDIKVIHFYCSHIHSELDKLEKTIEKKLATISGDNYNCSRYNYWVRRQLTNITGIGGKNKEDKDFLIKLVKNKLTYYLKTYKEWLDICDCGERNNDGLKKIFIENLKDAKENWNYRKEVLCTEFLEYLNIYSIWSAGVR